MQVKGHRTSRKQRERKKKKGRDKLTGENKGGILGRRRVN